jgi:serine/threonine-protein kinase
MTSEPAKHPTQIGQYQILSALDKGAVGQVYKATQPAGKRTVVVRVLPDRLAAGADDFDRELEKVARLDHANVVHLLEDGRDGDTRFLVSEYVPGSTLEAVLRKRRLSLQEAFGVFRHLCHGLEAAHRQGVVHRHLNPRNVLVSGDLRVVKIADFGLGRTESLSRDLGTLATAEASMGSLQYMAPEQARDLSAADARSDIYSAGAVLYEMLTGKVPLGRFGLPSQVASEVPPETDAIVLKCLASDPKERYGTVSQLLQALAGLEDRLRLGLVTELRGLTRSTSDIFRAGGRRTLILVVAGLTVLLVALVAFFYLGAG